mmetsp:Transcript_32337/g.77337  ORF Transcript_32337/g.77337 Transcript_32337/m.77337 type:complete len:614 (+) Transcript_32337:16-1857(+)
MLRLAAPAMGGMVPIWLLLTFCRAASFPSYEDPRTADPPLPHPGEPCAVLMPIVGANLTGYGQVVRGRLDPPACREWAQVVVHFDAAVKGVQFDRFGAVWFRGVELLRTTTPEPSPSGIHWHVQRDVTEFQQLFLESGEMMLMIPNIVDATYTGAIMVNVSVAFYPGEGPDVTVVPLQNASGRTNPLDAISYDGASSQVNLVKLGTVSPTRIRLDLFASGHGCEEFWYTNVPGTDAPPGVCAGGSYREILVYVDGMLAGACFPFPVIYSGGINPLLWRPLAGIVSFDLPPYEFDLTPFAGLLTDGATHNITVQVWGNNPTGNWFLDPVLLVEHGDGGIVGGKVYGATKAPHVTEVVMNLSNGSTVQRMQGQHEFEVRSILTLEDGREVECNLWADLRANSSNLGLESAQLTFGSFRSQHVSFCGDLSTTVKAEFPLYVYDFFAQDDTSMLLKASVDYTRMLNVSVKAPGSPDYDIQMRNAISSHAVYNRSIKNHSQVNVQTSSGTETFGISTGRRTPCYNKLLFANDGDILADHSRYDCHWPFGLYVCGSAICGRYGRKSTAELVAKALPRPHLRPPRAHLQRRTPLLDHTLRRPARPLQNLSAEGKPRVIYS